MTTETTLALLRHRLLRLLAGWLALAMLLRSVPLNPRFARAVRRTLAVLLSKAEQAVEYLLVVEAIKHVRLCRWDGDPGVLQPRSLPVCPDDPSFAALCRRIWVLRARLRTLPRHGLQRLRRVMRKAPSDAQRPIFAVALFAVQHCGLPAKPRVRFGKRGRAPPLRAALPQTS